MRLYTGMHKVILCQLFMPIIIYNQNPNGVTSESDLCHLISFVYRVELGSG
jgi:hypothetical protein